MSDTPSEQGDKIDLIGTMRNELATLHEQLAERDAEIAALKGHAEALRNRLVEEYTIGPCVDQAVGAALPHEVYDFDAAYQKED